MSINTTELLKLVRANEVSCVVSESFENSVEIPKILSKKEGTRVWCSFPDNTTVVSLFTRLKKFRSLSVDYVKQNNTYNDSSIVLSTSQFLKKKLMGMFDNGRIQTSKIDFCDIIVLGGTSLWTMDNTIILNLWRTILDTKKDIEIPRLVLSMFNLDIDSNIIPFDVSQSYFYIETLDKPSIQYHYIDYRPGDRELLNGMFDVIQRKHEEDDLEFKYLIYCPSFNDVVILSSKLKETKNIHMIFLTKDLDEKTASALNEKKKKDKRIVIISTNSLIPVQDIDVVFDCMTEKLEYKTSGDAIKMKSVYISKSISEQRCNVASNYCYRMCSGSKYQSLASQHVAESRRIPLTQTFLNVINKGFNPSKFFGKSITFNDVRDEMDLLKETKMIEVKIDKIKITKLGEFAMNVNLSRYNLMLLDRWILEQQQWFPVIVLSCLIEKADALYFYLPQKDKYQSIEEHDITVKEHFDKYFKKWSSESVLETYLNMWNAYADTISTLKPSIEDLKVWCRENSINFKSFNELLSLIVENFDKLEFMNRRQIKIGKFSAKKLLKLVNPIMMKVYGRNVCQLVDAEIYKYIDEKHGNFFLDIRRHYNPYVRVPYKVFAFSKVVIKTGRSEIRKIIFFHPVENKFLKDKKIEAPIRKEYKRSGYGKPLDFGASGYDPSGYDPSGYDPSGYDPSGYGKPLDFGASGYDPSGYDQLEGEKMYPVSTRTKHAGMEYQNYLPESPVYLPSESIRFKKDFFTPEQSQQWLAEKNFDPRDYRFEPDAPEYQPESPVYQPESPVYQPESPVYQPESPEYPPESPEYPPESPEYTVTEPSWVPEETGQGLSDQKDEMSDFEKAFAELEV